MTDRVNDPEPSGDIAVLAIAEVSPFEESGGGMRVKGLRAAWLASLPEPARNDLAAALSRAEARALLYDWPFWARPAQLPPQGNWRV